MECLYFPSPALVVVVVPLYRPGPPPVDPGRGAVAACAKSAGSPSSGDEDRRVRVQPEGGKVPVAPGGPVRLLLLLLLVQQDPVAEL